MERVIPAMGIGGRWLPDASGLGDIGVAGAAFLCLLNDFKIPRACV